MSHCHVKTWQKDCTTVVLELHCSCVWRGGTASHKDSTMYIWFFVLDKDPDLSIYFYQPANCMPTQYNHS